MQLLLDHDHYIPNFVIISEAKMHDVTIVRFLPLNPASIAAIDRAHNDYRMFANWIEKGVYFVTRLKENGFYEVIQSRPIP